MKKLFILSLIVAFASSFSFSQSARPGNSSKSLSPIGVHGWGQIATGSVYQSPYNLRLDGDSCDNPLAVTALPYAFTESTIANYSNMYGLTMITPWGYGGADVVFHYTATANEVISFEVTGDFDQVMVVFTDCAAADSTSEIGAVDSNFQEPFTEVGSFLALTGEEFFFIVASYYDTIVAGSFTLNITSAPLPSVDDKNVTFEECFGWSGDFIPYVWTTVDVDQSGTYNFPLGLTYPAIYDPKGFIAFNADDNAATAFMPAHGGDAYAVCVASATPPNNDWLISPQTALGSGASISMWVKSYASDPFYGFERFRVLVSTTDGATTSFVDELSTAPYEEADTVWTEKTYDLSAYANQNVYIAINCVSNDAWVFEIDDIVINTNLYITDVEANNISIYPNPSTGLVNINNVAGAKVVVYNLIGKEVYTIESANQFNTVDLSEFGMGTYFVKVVSATETSTHVISITK
ncbi:MAG: T9SS type A sorting domain-containing protein [Haliscomenobacter sp.]|nr:T9SS type A sorting domain-containing protein [Haliscomenobacter sp.]